jgi:hypothetical protein
MARPTSRSASSSPRSRRDDPPARFWRARHRLDGAREQVGEVAPGELGADVCAMPGRVEEMGVGVEGHARARVAEDAADLEDVEADVDDQVAGADRGSAPAGLAGRALRRWRRGEARAWRRCGGETGYRLPSRTRNRNRSRSGNRACVDGEPRRAGGEVGSRGRRRASSAGSGAARGVQKLCHAVESADLQRDRVYEPCARLGGVSTSSSCRSSGLAPPLGEGRIWSLV